MCKSILFQGILLVSLLAPLTSSAAIIHVPDDQTTIQAGIDAASGGDTVLVSQGNYFENIDFLGKNITVASEFLSTQDTALISGTVIDGSALTLGDSLGSVVRIVSSELTSPRLIGFVIRNGIGTKYDGSLSTIYGRKGGGILVENAAPTIAFNIIKGNQTISTFISNGAGISGSNCSGINIYRNQIFGNYLVGVNEKRGGGIYAEFSGNVLIRGNKINGNSYDAIFFLDTEGLVDSNTVSGNDSGGIYTQGEITVSNNIFSDNGADAIFANYTDITVSGNVFAGNGRGIVSRASSAIISNNTIVNNHGAGPGGAIYKFWNSNSQNIDLSHNIIWNNSTDDGSPQVYLEEYVTLNASCNDIEMGESGVFAGSNVTVNYGADNIALDPLFCDSAAGDFRVSSQSPCAPSNSSCGMLIGALDASCGAWQISIEPDLMYAFYAYSVDQTPAYIRLCDMTPGQSLFDINTSTMQINGLTPLTFEFGTSSGTCQTSLTIGFVMSDFVGGYEPLWDTTIQVYQVTGEMKDESPLAVEGSILMIGHRAGDVNSDQAVNMLDVAFLVSYLYKSGPRPRPVELADINGNCISNIIDVTYLVSYLFKNGPPPAEGCAVK